MQVYEVTCSIFKCTDCFKGSCGTINVNSHKTKEAANVYQPDKKGVAWTQDYILLLKFTHLTESPVIA